MQKVGSKIVFVFMMCLVFLSSIIQYHHHHYDCSEGATHFCGLHFSVNLFSFPNILLQMKNAVGLQSVFSIFALENEKGVTDFI